MRPLPALAAAATLAALASSPAAAAPFAVLAFSGSEGLSVVDVGSVTRDGPYPRAWAYVVLPNHPPQRVFLESSQVEFDCARSRMRVVSTVRYDDKDKALAHSIKPAAWEKPAPHTPGAAMHRQVCSGGFDPALLRGAGQTIFDYARTMRPVLARLKD